MEEYDQVSVQYCFKLFVYTPLAFAFNFFFFKGAIFTVSILIFPNFDIYILNKNKHGGLPKVYIHIASYISLLI